MELQYDSSIAKPQLKLKFTEINKDDIKKNCTEILTPCYWFNVSVSHGQVQSRYNIGVICELI